VSHRGEDASVELIDARHTDQRHGNVELVSQNLNRAFDASRPCSAEPINVSAPNQAAAGAERDRAYDVLAGADAAIE
jgi:hypothetical protein